MAAGQTDATKAIRKNDDEFERNVRAQNAPALVEAFYAEEAVVLPPNQPMVSGRASIMELFQGLFGAGLRDAALEIVRVDESGDLAAELGKYTLTIGTAQDKGKYLVVWRRQPDGAWRAIADMFSSDSPA